ncbi:MAG: transpeptidase family protein [Bacteroidales bacterium]|nr:transpeptidase family protein [Bacteroidales bacterium]
MKDDSKIIHRAYVFLVVVIIASFVIIGRIVYLQAITPAEEKEAVSVMTKTVKSKRGDIYSSDGKLLATSVCYYDTYLDLACQGVRAMTDSAFDADIDSLSICLADLFRDKTKDAYRAEIRNAKNKGSRSYCIKRRVSYIQYEQMKKFPYLRKGKYAAGFYSTEIYEREKPFGKLARRTIGECRENAHFGLEYCYDSVLTGVEGYATFQKVSKDVWVPLENSSDYIRPVDGLDLITTIDIGLQDIAETELENQMSQHSAQYGTVVVMEVKTGKVRAMANLERDTNNNFYENYNYAVGNLSSGGAPDPGSTFKIASVIVAMEDGHITPNTIVHIGKGEDTYFGKKIVDSHRYDRDTSLTVSRIIELSSNVGTARFVYDHYKENQQKFVDGIKRLHLNEPLGIDLKGEAVPVIYEPSDPNNWSKISLPWMAYGYGVAITPLQILAFYNAIANNGTLLRPMFVEGFASCGKMVKTFEPYVIDQQICSQPTIDAVKKMLEGVVQNGTAVNLKNENYQIAGKTGTAQMNYGKHGEKITYHASFVGYFPADNPEYSCVVSIYNPSENGFYGNKVAGNVFRKIADRIYSTDTKAVASEVNDDPFSQLPISKSGKRESIQAVCEILDVPTNIENFSTVNWIKFKDNSDGRENFVPYSPVSANRVPDVRNMGASDAVVLLERNGLKVVFSGRGRVVTQIPEHGTMCEKGDTVFLTLK